MWAALDRQIEQVRLELQERVRSCHAAVDADIRQRRPEVGVDRVDQVGDLKRDPFEGRRARSATEVARVSPKIAPRAAGSQ